MSARKVLSTTPASLRSWLGQRLLRWFDRHHRDLPWRRSRDPYRIWVSEVMLQQTQVATVIPYFERFLRAFPTLADLAAASEQDVLRLWEGLGYYRRARDLHAAARILADEYSGVVPTDQALLARLPGMGRYTVNAVLSQAFDTRLPILEANSRRVLCRLFGRAEDPTREPLRSWLWRTAEEVLPRRRAGDFNQALMELGALVCTTSPRCDECPLRNRCIAHQHGLQETIPYRRPAPVPVAVHEIAVVLRRGSRVLLARRPAAGRWANLWEFPHGQRHDGESDERAVGRVLKELTGMSGRPGQQLLTIRHGVMHYAISMVCLEAVHQRGSFRSHFYAEGRWVVPAELAAYPVSAPQRRLARILGSA